MQYKSTVVYVVQVRVHDYRDHNLYMQFKSIVVHAAQVLMSFNDSSALTFFHLFLVLSQILAEIAYASFDKFSMLYLALMPL